MQVWDEKNVQGDTVFRGIFKWESDVTRRIKCEQIKRWNIFRDNL